MKLLLDQHLSRKLVGPLQSAYPGTTHVVQHALHTRDDETVWGFARAGGYAIATRDEDFQVLSFARGHPPKVLWLRGGNTPTRHVLDVLLRARPMIEHFESDGERSLLVLP